MPLSFYERFKAITDLISSRVNEDNAQNVDFMKGIAAFEVKAQLVDSVDYDEIMTYQLHASTRQLLERAFREALDVLLQHRDKSYDDSCLFRDVGILLDLTLWLSEEGNCDPSTLALCAQDLFESLTLVRCSVAFDVLDARADRIAACLESGAKKALLLLLRVCIDLLRRLSKSDNAVLCGRVLLFLAKVFSLSDRSGVNAKGIFNLSNTTLYESQQEFELAQQELREQQQKEQKQQQTLADKASSALDATRPVDYNFYETFWQLQSAFQKSVSEVLKQQEWQLLEKHIEGVLGALDTQRITVSAQNVASSAADFYATKFLTSSKLMQLQLADANFRRHVLLQMLIFFNKVLEPSPKARDVAPTETQKSTLTAFSARVRELLLKTPPDGEEFVETITHVLEREKNWILWKDGGCEPFERPRSRIGNFADEKRKKRDESMQNSSNERKVMLGNAELTRLWNLHETRDNLEATTLEARNRRPSLAKFITPLREELELDGENNPFRQDRVFAWKALRLLARENILSHNKVLKCTLTSEVINILDSKEDVNEDKEEHQAQTQEQPREAKGEDTKKEEPALKRVKVDGEQEEAQQQEQQPEQQEGEEEQQQQQDEEHTTKNGDEQQQTTQTAMDTQEDKPEAGDVVVEDNTSDAVQDTEEAQEDGEVAVNDA